MDPNNQAIQGAALQQTQQTPSPTPEDTLAATKQALLKKKTPTLSDELAQGYDPASISQALAVVNPNGKGTPVQIGKAILSPEYAGYCQKFIDDTVGATQRYPTATATWNAKMQSGEAHQGLDGLSSGDVVEFSPDKSNGNMGHAAIVQKDGSLKMATYNGIQTFNLEDWQKFSGQVPLGYYKP